MFSFVKVSMQHFSQYVTAHSEEAVVGELTAEPSDGTWQGLFGGVRRSDIKDPFAHESGI